MGRSVEYTTVVSTNNPLPPAPHQRPTPGKTRTQRNAQKDKHPIMTNSTTRTVKWLRWDTSDYELRLRVTDRALNTDTTGGSLTTFRHYDGYLTERVFITVHHVTLSARHEIKHSGQQNKQVRDGRSLIARFR